mgnify:CR=1 FL=1
MKNAWEDLINDFLEVACRLAPDERALAINALKSENISAEHLEVHPAFSIDGKVMVVLKPGLMKECLFYFLEQRRIEKKSFNENRPLTNA